MHGQQNNKYTEMHGQQNNKYNEMHGQRNNKYTEMHGQQNVKKKLLKKFPTVAISTYKMDTVFIYIGQ